MHRFKPFLLLVLALSTFSVHAMSSLPRNMSLKAFDPHRKDFVCKHEADAVPPIDPQAEQWLQEGLAATSGALPLAQRDYKRAAEVWQQAADKKHWKAMLNLASLYAEGQGVRRDTERAVQIVEAGMKLGIPGAYDLMGTYHMEGLGVKQDASRAYAFWELAADMGSPPAQAYLGYALSGGYDNPKESSWDNRPVGLKMLECSFAQGHGGTALKLALVYQRSRTEANYLRALQTLHAGVKFGSEESATYLAATFRAGDPMVDHIVDKARAERYSQLARGIRLNRDLTYPNLDKVLPLPPAQLPKWDGNLRTLVDAAKGLVPAPVVPPTPGSQRSGRAHIPEGWLLPRNPMPPQIEAVSVPNLHLGVPPQYETTLVRYSGYWLPQLLDASEPRQIQWNRAQVPQHYAQGEAFEKHREGLSPSDGRVMWHYAGVPVQRAAQASDPRVVQGIARTTRIPEPRQTCTGDAACARTGVWFGYVQDGHAQARGYNRWDRQAYLAQGQAFPDPKDLHLDIAARDVTWLWLDNANEIGFAGFADLSLSDLHDAEGNPLA